MYLKSNTRVKMSNGNVIAEPFASTVGTRQGCNLSPALFNIYINDLANEIEDNGCDPVSLNGLKVNLLMYADDILLLSSSAKGLQMALDQVSKFCNEWKLTINFSKTKVMVFNKPSASLNKNDFTVNGKQVDMCTEYVYLGIVITSTGNFRMAISRLIMKAQKSYAGWRCSISGNYRDTTNAKVMCRLFDTLTKHILLYGCEVWAPFDKRLQSPGSLDNLLTGTPRQWESLHTKFCKQALGVHKRACVIASRAELGRYPLIINMAKTILDYWKRSTNPDADDRPLLRNAMMAQRHLNTIDHSPYIKTIKAISLYATGDDNVTDLNVEKIIDALRDKYYKRATECLKMNKKMEVYRDIKKIHRLEPYLMSNLKTEWKISIAKLRISAHNFPVEACRKLNIAKQDRKCMMCKTGILEMSYIICLM